MIDLILNTRSIGRLSDSQLFELCQDNSQLKIERNQNGELLIMSPTGGLTGKLNAEIIYQIETWNRKYKRGVVFDSSTGFLLENGAMRSPDMSWLLKSKWDLLTEEEKQKFPKVCPDFIIELRSSSDNLAQLKLKLEEWILNGATEAWLIDPIENKVYIYKPNSATQIIDTFKYVIQGTGILEGLAFELEEFIS